jgi:hypothetical protein
VAAAGLPAGSITFRLAGWPGAGRQC